MRERKEKLKDRCLSGGRRLSYAVRHLITSVWRVGGGGKGASIVPVGIWTRTAAASIFYDAIAASVLDAVHRNDARWRLSHTFFPLSFCMGGVGGGFREWSSPAFQLQPRSDFQTFFELEDDFQNIRLDLLAMNFTFSFYGIHYRWNQFVP